MDERALGAPALEPLDRAYEEDVVACGVRVDGPHHEPAGGTGEQARIVFSHGDPVPEDERRDAAREVLREVLLVAGEDRRRPRAGAAGWLKAVTVDQFVTGDHTFFVGRVESVEEGTAATSLSYLHSGYVSL